MSHRHRQAGPALVRQYQRQALELDAPSNGLTEHLEPLRGEPLCPIATAKSIRRLSGNINGKPWN